MKKTLGLFVFLFALTSYGQSSSIGMGEANHVNTSEVKIADQAASPKEDPNWRFLLGESNFSDTYSNSGAGLTLGIERDLGKLFSIGASFTQFKSTYTDSYSGGDGSKQSYSYTQNIEVISGYMGLTPIRYHMASFDFAGSLLLGALNISNGGPSTEAFYGASFVASLNKQIGIGIDTKISSSVKNMTALSLVGYY